MSVQTQIDRLASAKAAIKTAIEGKGVTVPDSALLGAYAALIEGIQAGGSSPSGNGVYGTYVVASDHTIGISNKNAILINTGLSKINFFAFTLDMFTSSNAEYKMISGIWIRKNDEYYGRRFQQNGSSYNSVYPGYTKNGNAFKDLNGTMQIPGITSTTKVVAGDRYDWFAF